MQITITASGIEEARKKIKSIQYQWKQPKSRMYKDLAAIIETSIRENFNAEGRPRWQPRQDNEPHPILDRTGAMRDSAESSARDGFVKESTQTNALSIWTPIYGHFHQYKTRRASLPVRKFVIFTQAEIAAMLFRIRQTLEEKADA